MQGVEQTLATAPAQGLDVAEIRRRYGSAFRCRPAIYWTDMLVSAAVGWTAFAAALMATFGSLEWAGYLGIAIFANLRAVLFIHEIAHIKGGTLRGFEIAWHAVVGAPLQVPSLMYVGSHNEHHKRSAFGTADDPEYAPIAQYSRFKLLFFVLSVAVVPIVLPLRWGLLAPLSYSVPGLRKLVVERLSTLGINPAYRRPLPKGTQAERWQRQELALGIVFWIAVVAFLSGVIGVEFWLTWVCMTGGILLINQVRTLAAHRYESDGSACDSADELLDSINLSGVPVLTALVAPVGLRYHALHHLLPAVPYHALGTLHRRLSRELPQEAEYHQAEAGGVFATVRDLWTRAQARETAPTQ
ncbi:MAG: fatty acid desaturase [Myxococcota bacterium]|nr:fatty acid desaturase [Myxococcota bacterium]